VQYALHRQEKGQEHKVEKVLPISLTRLYTNSNDIKSEIDTSLANVFKASFQCL